MIKSIGGIAHDAVGNLLRHNLNKSLSDRSRASIGAMLLCLLCFLSSSAPLHEWSYPLSERPETVDSSEGRRTYATPEPQTELTTWIFDEGTFVPSAKLVGDRRYSIISDYLNKAAGDAREALVRTWLENLFLNAEILSERYIRDINGQSVRDAFDSRRRLNFVVIEDGKVIGIYEVTSPKANKKVQLDKEINIGRKAEGGAHIKAPGRKGVLYDISNIETQRLDVDLETKTISSH